MRRKTSCQRQQIRRPEKSKPAISRKSKSATSTHQLTATHPVLQMQRTYGNRYVQRMLHGHTQRSLIDHLTGGLPSMMTNMPQLASQGLHALDNYYTENFLKQLDVDLANPAIAGDANQVLEGIKLAKQHAGYLKDFQGLNLGELQSSMEGIPNVPEGLLKGQTNALAAITKSTQTLSLVEKILTFTDSEARGAWIAELRAEMVRSKAGHLSASMDLLKFGTKTVNEIVSLSSITLQGLALVTKNPTLAAKVAKYVGFASEFADVAGPIADAFQVIGGVAKMIDPKDAQQALDGLVDAGTGGLNLFGTLAPMVSNNPSVAAWATRATALGIAITITYEEFKFLAKEVYSETILSTTWHGVNRTYNMLNKQIQKSNKYFVPTQQYINDFEGADALQQNDMMRHWNYLLPHMNYNAQEIFNLGAYGLNDYPYISVYFEEMRAQFAGKLESAVLSLRNAQDMQDPFLFWIAAMQSIDLYKIIVQIMLELMNPENQKDIVKKQSRYFATKYGSGRNTPDLSDLRKKDK